MASSQSEESGPVFFWTCGQPNDFLSQWYPIQFTAPSPNKSEPPMTFFHTEQYMMYHKAILFQDLEIAEKIMATQKPAQVKALGRKVKGFDGKKWDVHKEKIVEEGNWNKFTTGEEQGLKEKLLNTGNRNLVEVPSDLLDLLFSLLTVQKYRHHPRTGYGVWDMMQSTHKPMKRIGEKICSVKH